MFKTATSLLSKIGSFVLIATIAWLAWDNLGPRKPEAGQARRELADKMLPDILEDLRENRQGIRSAALLQFANDPTDYVTTSLRTAIEHSGILDLRDTTATHKARSLLRLRHPVPDTLSEALKRARAFGTESVIFGTVHAFESFPGGAIVDIEVNLAHTASGDILFNQRYTRDSSKVLALPAIFEEEPVRSPWLGRVLVWLLIVLLLPVFTINFIRAMVRKQSNRANAFTLGVYTAADTLLALLVIGAAFGSWGAVLLFIATIAGALIYNFKVMEFALKLES